MIETVTTQERKDLLTGWKTSLLAWGLPIAGLVVGGALEWQPVVWPIAFAWIGVACLINARRCGRLHCYLTGPYFLLLAGLALAHGLALLPLGDAGWDWIGGAALIGGVVLYYLPERIWGKYLTNRDRRRDSTTNAAV